MIPCEIDGKEEYLSDKGYPVVPVCGSRGQGFSKFEGKVLLGVFSMSYGNGLPAFIFERGCHKWHSAYFVTTVWLGKLDAVRVCEKRGH